MPMSAAPEEQERLLGLHAVDGPMAFEIATELASSAPAAALNCASRPPGAAFVAADARSTCSRSARLNAVRSGTADASGAPAILSGKCLDDGARQRIRDDLHVSSARSGAVERMVLVPRALRVDHRLEHEARSP